MRILLDIFVETCWIISVYFHFWMKKTDKIAKKIYMWWRNTHITLWPSLNVAFKKKVCFQSEWFLKSNSKSYSWKERRSDWYSYDDYTHSLKALFTSFEYITFFSCFNKRNIYYRRSISMKQLWLEIIEKNGAQSQSVLYI